MNAKQTPLVDILRLHAEDLHSDYGHNKSARLLSQAADEIDRLRTTIERLREALESIAGGEIYPVQVALDALMAEVGESTYTAMAGGE